MSFKKFSSAHAAPEKTEPKDKSQNVPANDQPETETQEEPSADAPAPKP